MEGNTFFFQWEISLLQALQAHMGSFGKALASFFTLFGEEMILIVVLGFLYWCYDKKYGKMVGINLVAAVVLNPMIKNIFIRRRPYFDTPGIKCLKPVDASADIYDIPAQGYSFPSGHSMGAAVTYGSIAAYQSGKTEIDADGSFIGKHRKAVSICMVALVLLVGISRFCLGVHYPTDVFAGWVLGAALVFAIPDLQKKLNNDGLFYLILLLCCLPGFFFCTSSDYYSAYGIMVGLFAGFLFEERYVKFSNTKEVWRCILRVFGGLALFLGLNTLLKLPFSSEFSDSVTFAAHLVRTCRYAIVSFLIIGIYPMCFGRIGRKA